MQEKILIIKKYLKLDNYKKFAEILNTKEARIKYLASKSGKNAKLKKDEINILVNNYHFYEDWLTNDKGEMINETSKRNAAFLLEFNKLSRELQEYYYFSIKSENKKE